MTAREFRFASNEEPHNALTLPSGRIDLWFLFVDRVAAAIDLTAHYRELLTSQEKLCEQRFYFAKDRQRYLFTRALVRTVLSRYAPIAPKDWRFEQNPYGRPMAVNDNEVARRLSFNISHTDGLIMIAVTADSTVGADVEWTTRDVKLDLARSFFSAEEVAAIYARPAGEQQQRFLELWTLKESYIKARGMGLSIPLHKFAFRLDQPHGIEIKFDSDFDDSPTRWRFWQLEPSLAHIAALCVRSGDGGTPSLVSRVVVPLGVELAFDCPVTRNPFVG